MAKTKLYPLTTFYGEFYDATVYSSGGTYHKVRVENIETGQPIERKFYSRVKAVAFAEATANDWHLPEDRGEPVDIELPQGHDLRDVYTPKRCTSCNEPLTLEYDISVGLCARCD